MLPFDSLHANPNGLSVRYDGAGLRLAVLISGRGSNLGALMKALAAEERLSIVLVISNLADAGGLKIAEQAGIPTVVVEHRDFATRLDFDRELDRLLRSAGIDLLCLAGFMRILTDEFVQKWAGRMINIHPSLLPKYPGLNTHERAIAAGDREAGCTVHFVTALVDQGEIILQARVPIYPDDDRETLAARVLSVEHQIYPQAVRLISQRILGTFSTVPDRQGQVDG
ncbi:MAG: phosphoribosylglycinamide formyltransferase [Alphaproteobacteria bacterium]|nr:phosphoribosylglycinamide formyltransferase [Alphaproteobacteria bacterium]